MLGIPSTALLDTSEVERAEAVEPLQEFLSAAASQVSRGMYLP